MSTQEVQERAKVVAGASKDSTGQTAGYRSKQTASTTEKVVSKARSAYGHEKGWYSGNRK